MALPALTLRQRDFSGGQVNASARRRDDTKILRAALRTATNVMVGPTGSAADRPSRAFSYFDPGRPMWVRPAAGVRHKVSFGNGTFTARAEDGTTITTLTGCPWATADLQGLRVAVTGARVIVTSHAWQTQVLTWDGTAWSRAAFAFYTDPGSTVHQPYYRFADAGVTMQPSALTGDITVVLSADVFVAGHVGTTFRYYDQAMTITAVTDGMNASATVVGQKGLPPTIRYTMHGGVTGFNVGDVIQGQTTGAQGYVVALSVADGTLDVLMFNNYVGFTTYDATGGFPETVIGPTASTYAASGTAISPAAVDTWDEQLVSDVRGWPGSCFYDAARVGFCNFSQLGEAVVWCAPGIYNDGLVTGDPDGAIFELLPQNCVVQDVLGSGDEFVMTDAGIYYVPISGSNPLKPGSVEFRRVWPHGVANIAPALAPVSKAGAGSQAVLAISADLKRVLAIVATGAYYVYYTVTDTTVFHSDLLNAPTSIIAAVIDTPQPGVLAYLVNGDGSLMVGRYNTDEQWIGWTPWRGVGAVAYIAADASDTLIATDYAATPGTVRVVEVPTPGLLAVDCSVAATDTATLSALAGLTASLFQDGNYRGDFVVAGDGSLTGWVGGTSGVTVGFPFATVVSPFLPTEDSGADSAQGMKRRRIKRAMAVLEGSAGEVTFCGRRYAAYGVNDAQDSAPVLRDQVIRGRVLGRSFDPQFTLARTTPGRIEVVELSAEVTL